MLSVSVKLSALALFLALLITFCAPTESSKRLSEQNESRLLKQSLNATKPVSPKKHKIKTKTNSHKPVNKTGDDLDLKNVTKLGDLVNLKHNGTKKTSKPHVGKVRHHELKHNKTVHFRNRTIEHLNVKNVSKIVDLSKPQLNSTRTVHKNKSHLKHKVNHKLNSTVINDELKLKNDSQVKFSVKQKKHNSIKLSSDLDLKLNKTKRNQKPSIKKVKLIHNIEAKNETLFAFPIINDLNLIKNSTELQPAFNNSTALPIKVKKNSKKNSKKNAKKNKERKASI